MAFNGVVPCEEVDLTKLTPNRLKKALKMMMKKVIFQFPTMQDASLGNIVLVYSYKGPKSKPIKFWS